MNKVTDYTKSLDSDFVELVKNLKSSDEFLLLGNQLINEDKYKEALFAYEQGSNRFSSDTELTYNYAASLSVNGFVRESLDVIYKLRQHLNLNPLLLKAMIRLCRKLGDYALASQMFEQVKVWDKQLYLDRIRNYSDLGLIDLCAENIAWLSERLQNDGAVLKQLSIIAARIRHYDLAIELNNQYMSMVEVDTQAYIQSADLYLMAKDVEKAQYCLELAEKNSNDNPSISGQLLQAKIFRLTGNESSALALSLDIVQKDNFNGEAWSIISEFSNVNELSRLSEQLSSYLMLNGWSNFNKVSALYACGKMFERMAIYDSAFTRFDEANNLQKAELIKAGKLFDVGIQQGVHDLTERLASYCKSHTVNSYYKSIESAPVFIVGLPRTGTTLVEKIIAQHSDVQKCGENEQFTLLASDLMKELDKCSSDKSSTDKDVDEVLAKYYDKYILNSKITSKYFTDKMPHNVNYIPLILKVFPTAKIICMDRNPLDILMSIFKLNFSDGHSYACDLGCIASYIEMIHSLSKKYINEYPENVVRVRYELLVESPQEIMRSVFDFIGLEWNDAFLDVEKNTEPSYTFSEVQVRKPISKNGVNSWENYRVHLEKYSKLYLRHV